MKGRYHRFDIATSLIPLFAVAYGFLDNPFYLALVAVFTAVAIHEAGAPDVDHPDFPNSSFMGRVAFSIVRKLLGYVPPHRTVFHGPAGFLAYATVWSIPVVASYIAYYRFGGYFYYVFAFTSVAAAGGCYGFLMHLLGDIVTVRGLWKLKGIVRVARGREGTEDEFTLTHFFLVSATLLYLYSAGWDTVSAGAVAYAVSIAFHFWSVLKRAEIERFGYTVS